MATLLTKLTHYFNYKGVEITRFLFLRGLGFMYSVAFLIFVFQWEGLLGSNGLSPVQLFLSRLSSQASFWDLPSIFWFGSSDIHLATAGYLGLSVSILTLFGLSNAIALAILWALYFSIISVGQQFYSFGWETMLIETGFFAIFLCPVTDWRPFSKKSPPALPIFLLILWISFRNMLGSGLIKIRGDASWRDLTALYYHFETQPVPNPMSRTLHFLPKWILKTGVLFNHFVELIVPFFLFAPRLLRQGAAGLIIVFQIMLIISGNLAFLNHLSILLCIPAFDDQFFRQLFRQKFFHTINALKSLPLSIKKPAHLIQAFLIILVLYLSIPVITNLIGPRQLMNTSFNPLRIVNTYGAFGHVGKQRFECVVLGTTDTVISPRTVWKEYEFKAKPHLPRSRPPLFSPYHYRLDWHIWFAAMSSYQQHPWLVHLVYKLLQNDTTAQSLLKHSPFEDQAPTFIKIDRYHYAFSAPKENSHWDRQKVANYLPPLSLQHQGLRLFIQQHYSNK